MPGRYGQHSMADVWIPPDRVCIECWEEGWNWGHGRSPLFEPALLLARISHSVIKQNLWNRRKESVHRAFERQNTEVLR